MRCLTTAHTIIPIILAFIYIYFMILLNHILWLGIVLLIVFLILFVLYALAIYALFHKHPGYETYQSAHAQGSQNQMSVDKIGEYKENQRRLHQLLVMMRQNITIERLKQLRKQYVDRYQQPSFCNTCQVIKCPRTVHCRQCDKCVLRREKHSEIVNMCIGARNMKIFIQYLFISMMLSMFMTVSLLLITTLEEDKLDNFNEFQLSLFSVFEVVMGAAVLLFGKEFFISYFNALDNITQTQRKLDIITKNNNPFKSEKYYEKLFQTNLDFFKLQDIADPNNWLQFNEQNQMQQSN